MTPLVLGHAAHGIISAALTLSVLVLFGAVLLHQRRQGEESEEP